LGSEGKISKLEIRWPSGKVQAVPDIAINRLHEVVEP